MTSLSASAAYTQSVADVGAGTVRAVTIGPAGQVTGTLAGGQPFATIPVALGGNGLAGDLAAHHVQVTAAATSSSLLSVLAGLLPLLLIGGLIYFVIRSARRPAGDRVHRRDQRPRRPPRCRPGSIAAMLGAGLARRRPSAGSADHVIRAAGSCPLALRLPGGAASPAVYEPKPTTIRVSRYAKPQTQ
jgi:hypothetical protein